MVGLTRAPVGNWAFEQEEWSASESEYLRLYKDLETVKAQHKDVNADPVKWAYWRVLEAWAKLSEQEQMPFSWLGLTPK